MIKKYDQNQDLPKKTLFLQKMIEILGNAVQRLRKMLLL